MPDVLVRDVPQPTLDLLKQRAAHHRRSLQRELLGILESAAQRTDSSPARLAAEIRSRLAAPGRAFGDSVPLIRADRER